MKDKIKKVIYDRVILTQVQHVTKQTSGGIFIPDNADMIQKGKVRNIGVACTQTEIGEWVIFEKGAAMDMMLGEEKISSIRENDIMLVLQD